MKNFMRILKDEDGQGMVEYGLIIGLIAIVVVAALVTLGPAIRDKYTEIEEALDTGAGS